MKKNGFLKISQIMLSFSIPLIIMSSAMMASATAPFYDYSYNTEKDPVNAPRSYELYRTLDARAMGTALKDPSDVFVSNREIFIADTGNNRIVVLNDQFQIVREFVGTTDSSGNTVAFSRPEGVFVTEDNRVFIADTGNARLVVLNREGNYLNQYGQPDTDILPDDFHYAPSKVAVDKAGRFFVVSSNFNMGLLEFDKNGHFVQTLGAAKVQVTFTELFVRLISTKSQQERMAQFVPTEFNNLTVDSDGFVYATTAIYDEYNISAYGDTAVRKLNATGTDILKRAMPTGDLLYTVNDQFAGPSRIVDVYSGEYGMYSVLDANRGRIFTYDSSGTLLYVFGTYGDMAGALKNPKAFDKLDDLFLVLDANKNSITAYCPTAYSAGIDQAVQYHYQDKYEAESEQWEKVLVYNNNSDIAYNGMGKAALRYGDYAKAMKYFRISGDRTDYSKAFQSCRRQMISQHFMWAVPVLLGGILFIAIAVKIKRKYRPAVINPASFRGKLGYSRYVVFHPIDGFWDLKREGRGSVRISLLFAGALCLVTIAQRQMTGYLFNMAKPGELNVFVEVSKVLLPFGLWCISNWCVTSLMQGEGKLRDIVTMTGYALRPMLILDVVGIVLSNLITQKEGDFYVFLVTVGILWSLGLIILGHQQIHDYTLGRSLFIIFLSIVVMAVVVFLSILLVVLLQQMIGFAGDFINELLYRLQ